MIFKDMEEVRRHLRVGLLLPCYFVSGTDDRRKRAVVRKLSELTVAGGTGFDSYRFSGNVSADTLADAAFAITFGGGKRCVVAEDVPLNSLGDNEYKKFEELVGEVSTMGGGAVLIFTFSAVDPDQKKEGKRNRFDSLKKKIDQVGGGVIRCDTASVPELCTMMERAAEQYHCSLNRDLCNYMVERCGQDSALLLNEVKKVAEFHGEGTITKMEIDLLTCPTPDARIYDLTAKITARDRDGAFGVLEELRELGENPAAILSVLSGAYLDLFRAKAAKNAGKGKAEIVADWPKYARRDFVVGKALTAQSRYTASELLRCLDILLDAEQRIKSTGLDDDLILDETVARLFAVK